MRIEWFGRQQNPFPPTGHVTGGGVAFSNPGRYGPVEIKPSEEIPVDFGDDDKWTPADGHWLAYKGVMIEARRKSDQPWPRASDEEVQS